MMRIHDLQRALRACALSLTLAVLFLVVPAHAQNNNGAGGGATTTTRTENRDDRRDDRREVRGEDNDRDWGWLGLLGLAGLLGLMPRKRVPVVVDRDRDTGTRTTSGRDVGHNR